METEWKTAEHSGARIRVRLSNGGQFVTAVNSLCAHFHRGRVRFHQGQTEEPLPPLHARQTSVTTAEFLPSLPTQDWPLNCHALPFFRSADAEAIKARNVALP